MPARSSRPRHGHCRHLALALALALPVLPWLLWPATGRAAPDAPPHAPPHRDEQRALAAVQAGRALPLARLLSALEAQLPGQAIDVELDEDDGRLVYEITWLLPDQRVLKLELDAATGDWLELKGRALETVFRRRARP